MPRAYSILFLCALCVLCGYAQPSLPRIIKPALSPKALANLPRRTPAAAPAPPVATNNFTLAWSAIPPQPGCSQAAAFVVVQESRDLIHWRDLTNLSDAPGDYTLAVSSTASNTFWRILAVNSGNVLTNATVASPNAQ